MGEIQNNQQNFTSSFGDHNSSMAEQFVSKFETSSAATTATTTTAVSSSDVDMEGVEAEVSQLTIHDYKVQPQQNNIAFNPSTNDKDESMEDDDSRVPGLCEDEGTDLESGDEEENENEGEIKSDDSQTQSNATNEINIVNDVGGNSTESNVLDQSQDQTSQTTTTTTSAVASSTSTSAFPTEPSVILMSDAVYSAVPVSSELYIIPHSSKGFNWNADNFMKPHQRRTLGVDEMYNAGDSGSSHDTTVSVHEIRLDDEESQQILPS
ncbi:hypothetical protein BGZ76_010000 [Entomortierella beljakovae]|nr:hypothetical protein BGZ76_010000 [Entomortierella beljakovae]